MGNQSGKMAAELPAKVFRFKWKLIEPGDVICSTIKANPVSMLIRALTSSDFSHVSMCVETKGFIEANESVARFSLLHIGCIDPKNVKVIRLRDDVANARESPRCWKRGFEIPRAALLDIWDFPRSFEVSRLPCNPGLFVLIWWRPPISSAGLQIVPNVPPQHITPRDIAECPLFQDISKTVLDEIPHLTSDLISSFWTPTALPTRPICCRSQSNLMCATTSSDEFEALVKQRPRSLIEAQKVILVAKRQGQGSGQQTGYVVGRKPKKT